MTTNNKKLPTAVRFILADDIREETNKKISIIGAFTSNDITITEPETATPPKSGQAPSKVGGFPLALLAILDNVQGTYDAKLNLFSPSGEEMGGGLLSVKADNVMTLNLIFKFPFFPVRGPGMYKAVLNLGNAYQYVYEFQIRFQKPTT